MGYKPIINQSEISDIDPRFLRDIKVILILTINIIVILSLLSFSPSEKKNLMGYFGYFLAKILYDFLGYGAWIIPILFFIIIYDILKGLLSPTLLKFSILFSGWTSIFISSCGFFEFAFNNGGVTGKIVYNFMPDIFGLPGFLIIILFLFVSGIIAVTPLSLSHLKILLNYLKKTFLLRKGDDGYLSNETDVFSLSQSINNLTMDRESEFSPKIIEPQKTPKKSDESDKKDAITINVSEAASEIIMPTLDLLTDAPGDSRSIDKEYFIRNSRKLEQTLLDFGVAGNVVEICPGPVVTMYEFSPAPGVKINKISSLSDDIALALGALSVRIIAPIPGKSVVGIEISNENREIVYLKEILTSETYTKFKGILPLALGKDIVGQPVVVDLAKMPHLLIAGATGTGKSVGLNAMICSILYRLGPKSLRFLMIDPKRIELSPYDNIPHLIHPVISDAKIATKALLWLVNEMEMRYCKLDQAGARNLESFNKITGESIPYLIVVIDELSDLMMVSSKDVESSIMRLAQKARAAGIHLIVATQRPSVDVITGLIKANFPSRISFKVSSKVDSRTILDVMGAERLLGMGDMLYLAPGTSHLKRVHGAFVSDKEVTQIANFLRNQAKPVYDIDIKDIQNEEESLENGFSSDDIDEKYDEAIEIVRTTGQTSISFLQRKLKVGYNRSARMIEQMEKDGILSAPDHTGKRKILLDSDE